jgi:hypothetical protein
LLASWAILLAVDVGLALILQLKCATFKASQAGPACYNRKHAQIGGGGGAALTGTFWQSQPLQCEPKQTKTYIS